MSKLPQIGIPAKIEYSTSEFPDEPALPIKRTAGQPTKYSKKLCKQMIELMAEGKKDCQMFVPLGITRQTFYKWLRENPEFKEAHDFGLELAEKWWEDEGLRQAMAAEQGVKYNFNYWIAFMNRKFGWHKNNTSGDQTQININNMNVLNASKSVETLQAEILEQLKDLDIGYTQEVQEQIEYHEECLDELKDFLPEGNKDG